MTAKDEIERAAIALQEAVRIHGPELLAKRPPIDEVVAMVRRID